MKPIRILKNFINKYYVSLSREKEEFYSILSAESTLDLFKKQLDEICEASFCGNFKRQDIVFTMSQINLEFANFISEMQKVLKKSI